MPRRRGGVRDVPVDVSNWAAVQSIGDDVLARDGVPDDQVCAAGINPLAVSSAAIDEDFWLRGVDVNLKGIFVVCRALILAMAERGRGSALNLASRPRL